MGNLRAMSMLLIVYVSLFSLLLFLPGPVEGGQTFDKDLPAGVEIDMIKTVSDDGSCGIMDVITVTWTTSLTYCYTATNTGDVTLTTHTLTDTVLISILDNFSYDLAPKASVVVTATFDPPNMIGPLENCALWTAWVDSGASAQSADCATVYILAPTNVGQTSFEAVNRPVAMYLIVVIAAIVLGICALRRVSVSVGE